MLENLGSSNKNLLDIVKKQEESHVHMVAALGKMGSSLEKIEKLLTQALATYTLENLVLQTYPQPFRANGYQYNSLFIGDASVTDNTKLFIDGIGIQYSKVLASGENLVNIPDGATFWVTTSSGNPVTAILSRYNSGRA